MELLSIIILALALSMDSFAVSISNGFLIKDINLKKILIIASSLAFFQATMPLLGWLLGVGIEHLIRAYDHWVAFFLLSFIGIKMIYDALKPGEDSCDLVLKPWTLVAQSFATSIDALAVGVSFALLNISICMPIIFIGIITFIASVLGLVLGKYFGKKLGHSFEIIGGIILVGLGLKILIEHLIFNI